MNQFKFYYCTEKEYWYVLFSFSPYSGFFVCVIFLIIFQCRFCHHNIEIWWLLCYFNRLVPAKLMRDWTALFISGKPLYEQAPPPESTEPSPEQILEEERQALLDEGDFSEYKVGVLWDPFCLVQQFNQWKFHYKCILNIYLPNDVTNRIWKNCKPLYFWNFIIHVYQKLQHYIKCRCYPNLWFEYFILMY